MYGNCFVYVCDNLVSSSLSMDNLGKSLQRLILYEHYCVYVYNYLVSTSLLMYKVGKSLQKLVTLFGDLSLYGHYFVYVCNIFVHNLISMDIVGHRLCTVWFMRCAQYARCAARIMRCTWDVNIPTLTSICLFPCTSVTYRGGAVGGIVRKT